MTRTSAERPETSDAGGEDEGTPDPRRWKALAVCLVGGFMVLLDVSIVNVALPSIRDGLGASESDLQWVVSGYALTFGLLLVPAGRIGDARGRRTMFVVALALFTLASLACGLAPGSLFLVVARLVQGLAGGLLTPQISALIQQLFRGRERGKAFGLFGTMVGISTAVGPLLGGAADRRVRPGPRLAVRVLRQPADRAGRHAASRGGCCPAATRRSGAGTTTTRSAWGCSVPAIVVLLLPLVQEQQWKGNGKWLLVPLAAVLLARLPALGAPLRAARDKEPLVDLALFRQRSYSFGTDHHAVLRRVHPAVLRLHPEYARTAP